MILGIDFISRIYRYIEYNRSDRNWKVAERDRLRKLEEFERKVNVQLERQLVMTLEWSIALLGARMNIYHASSKNMLPLKCFSRHVPFSEYTGTNRHHRRGYCV